MADLQQALPSLKGKRFGQLEIQQADDFAYHDPIDGSITEQQGIRILFPDRRIVFRLSGTGTQGATLRIYFERYEPHQCSLDNQQALAELVSIAQTVAQI